MTLVGQPGSSVGIVTDYGLDGPGIESQWGRDFPPIQTGLGAHPASCTMGTGSFPGVKCGRGVLLKTHPLLVPRSWKSRAIPLHPPLGHNRARIGVTLLLPLHGTLHVARLTHNITTDHKHTVHFNTFTALTNTVDIKELHHQSLQLCKGTP